MGPIVEEWQRRIAASYRGAGVGAQLVHMMIATGFPRPLVDRAHGLVCDQLDHADLALVVMRAYGGREGPSLPAESLGHPPMEQG